MNYNYTRHWSLYLTADVEDWTKNKYEKKEIIKFYYIYYNDIKTTELIQ